jgi:hypothetical protein
MAERRANRKQKDALSRDACGAVQTDSSSATRVGEARRNQHERACRQPRFAGARSSVWVVATAFTPQRSQVRPARGHSLALKSAPSAASFHSSNSERSAANFVSLRPQPKRPSGRCKGRAVEKPGAEEDAPEGAGNQHSAWPKITPTRRRRSRAPALAAARPSKFKEAAANSCGAH